MGSCPGLTPSPLKELPAAIYLVGQSLTHIMSLLECVAAGSRVSQFPLLYIHADPACPSDLRSSGVFFSTRQCTDLKPQSGRSSPPNFCQTCAYSFHAPFCFMCFSMFRKCKTGPSSLRTLVVATPRCAYDSTAFTTDHLFRFVFNLGSTENAWFP